MDNRRWIHRKTTYASRFEGLQVTSIEWKAVTMSEEEEDLIFRMYKLVGDRWSLIAGRIPGRTPEVIERYWLMKHGFFFAN
ncbi:PREDICTED: transcription factor CPC-like [Camelina sativa]|uniref:Transcription factor CPC-like n=1 Tax=Camelina sativa TaxID=90675 RepID=A0ABM0SME0_CAMSA|nr:PREDICTED: transcription factor CPC-like [Camelina sativa]